MRIEANAAVRRRRLWLLAPIIVGALVVAAPALAAPPGNNGTVKIHEGATEIEPIVANEPHVCTFHVHFLFADPVQAGTWRILSWPPTGDRSVVLSGTYDTDPEGEDRVPEAGVFTLDDGHYRLEWTGRTERTMKHKVFWVDCPAASASPSASPSGSASASPSGSVVPDTSASPTGGVEPTVVVSEGPSGSVLGVVGTPPATDVGAPASSSGSGWGVAVGLLVAVSAALLVATRRTRRTIARR